MAVSNMSACCRASLLSLFLLGCFLQVLIQGEVFQAPRRHDVFLRSKRANMFLLEELLQGNLERECYEELCSYEEAREYFEDTDMTVAFWTVYYDGDQCDPNPCLHGGNCTDKMGGFHCSCPAPRYGPVCELGDEDQVPVAPQIVTTEPSECPTEGPAACHQLCTVSRRSFTCSCMSGFKLQADGRSCRPEAEFPCGRLADEFNSSASMCRHGNCPWQVSLQGSRWSELCVGVVLGRRSVLTSARCLFLDSASEIRPSDFHVIVDDERMLPVQALYIHDRFRTDHYDNDLALLKLASPLHFNSALIHLCLPTKDFSENVLMHSERRGIAEGRGAGQTQTLVYMTKDECYSQLNVPHPLSNKMFCMRRQTGPPENRSRVQRSPKDQNQNHSLNVVHGKPSGAEDKVNSPHEPSEAEGRSRSEGRGRKCGGLLPGTPVVTVHQGTVFLTGLLTSSSAGCDGALVFTKLSRFVNWIRPRLEAAEGHVTPQINRYPGNR